MNRLFSFLAEGLDVGSSDVCKIQSVQDTLAQAEDTGPDVVGAILCILDIVAAQERTQEAIGGRARESALVGNLPDRERTVRGR